MATSYEDIQEKIRVLQEKADEIKKREAIEVVAKIKEAIKAYGFKPADLFGPRFAGSRGKERPAKYGDDKGNTWHGIGRHPDWYRKAIKQGKTPEDLLIKR